MNILSSIKLINALHKFIGLLLLFPVLVFADPPSTPPVNTGAPAKAAPPTTPASEGAPPTPNAAPDRGSDPGSDPGPDSGQAPPSASTPPSTSDPKSTHSEEEDFSNSPFLEYGQFMDPEEEEADARFFQFGRFFGVSLGLGFEFIDGNRGALWNGGFPVVDFKLHYWFDFNIALDLGFYTATHYYQNDVQSLGHVDVNMLQVGVDLKYYFNTRNLSAPITFANPYVAFGAGMFSKTQNSINQQAPDNDVSLGVNGGFGMEFVMNPKKVYFVVEAKIHVVSFKDTSTTIFQPVGLQNLSGNFYTTTGSILFTW